MTMSDHDRFDALEELQERELVDGAEEGARIVVCQGEPVCALKGREAFENQLSGCPYCEVHVLTDAENGVWDLIPPATKQ